MSKSNRCELIISRRHLLGNVQENVVTAVVRRDEPMAVRSAEVLDHAALFWVHQEPLRTVKKLKEV